MRKRGRPPALRRSAVERPLRAPAGADQGRQAENTKSLSFFAVWHW